VSAAILDSVRPVFRAAATAFIPETAAADSAAWGRLETIVAGALEQRPPGLRRQILIFIRLLDLISRLRYGTGLASLDAARRTALLERVSRSRLLLLRRGVWGLRTLVQMGWYTQPEVQQQLGYRATRAGWEARR
jgi:hypothetical protein